MKGTKSLQSVRDYIVRCNERGRIVLLHILILSSCFHGQTVAAQTTESTTRPVMSLAELLVAASNNDANAQFELGVRYYKGDGVPKSDVKAIDWFMKAAGNGNQRAQRDVGFAYLYGIGVPKDESKAIPWLLIAAPNYPEAECALGELYGEGRGVAKDLVTAAKWMQKAADRSYPPAQADLGNMFYYGLGVPQDFTRAVRWYRAAVAQGNPEGEMRLGYCYECGNGVGKDIRQATEWYKKAASQNNAHAKQALRRLAGATQPNTRTTTH